MKRTSPTRRVLGLVAASAVGTSTLVVALAGVAHATTVPSWHTSGSGAQTAVPAGICTIQWDVVGGGAGVDSTGAAGGLAGDLQHAVIPVSAGTVFTLYPGGAGGAAADGSTPGTGGTSSNPDTTLNGQDGTSDGTTAGGGGGAASTVLRDGQPFLRAHGASGAPTAGGAGGGGTNLTGEAEDDGNLGDAPHTGAGTIMGIGQPCEAPAPWLGYVTPGDGTLSFDFTQPPADTVLGGVDPTGYDYTLDNGVTYHPLTVVTTDGRLTGTISGLTNETGYTFFVRSLLPAGAGVPSHASNTLTGTPYLPAGAPTHVVVTTSPGSVTVTWGDPSQTTPAVGGYGVGWSQGERGNEFCEVAATIHTCTQALPPGVAYTITVTSVDTQNRMGGQASADSGVVPFPASVPSSDGTLTPAGAAPSALTPGATITVSGSGYAPGSTVTVLVYSTPQVLTTVVADPTGAFSVQVAVPAGLPAGNHTLVASGVDTLGNVRTMTLPVTVTGGTTGTGGVAHPVAARTVARTALAYTGFDAVGASLLGLAAVATGGALMIVGRRRRDA